ncbi:hypothetical protein FRC17_002304, partial [Serendipita sp. 399]
MASNEQVDKQCQQLLNELSNCVNGALAHQIHGMSSEQRLLQQEITDTRAALIRTTLGTLLSQLNETRNKYSPISRLVDEILIEIWSYTGAYDRFSISEVCQRWRRVSLGAAKLWTEINLDTLANNQLTNTLRRCGNAPLQIIAMNRRSTSELSPEQYYNDQRYAQRVDERGWCESGRKGTMINEEAGYRDEKDALADNVQLVGFRRAKPSIPRDVLRNMVQRAKSIHAVMGRDNSFHLSYDTLNTAVSLLQELSLSVERHWNHASWDYSPEDDKPQRGKWFNGISPLLRHLDLSVIHAPWDDPVYSNLTYLRLDSPQTTIRLPDLLRILRQCPTLEWLDITDCLSSARTINPFTFGAIFPPANRDDHDSVMEVDIGGKAYNSLPSGVVLNNLLYLHMDESDSSTYADFLSNISCPALQTLVICAPNLTCLSRQLAKSLHSIFSRTTQLQLSLGEYGQLTAIGRSNTTFGYENYLCTNLSGRFRRAPGPGWSFCSKRQLTQVPVGQTESDSLHLLESLEALGMPYDQIELVDITGQINFKNGFYHDMFRRCFHLKRLHFRPWPRFVTGSSAFGF